MKKIFILQGLLALSTISCSSRSTLTHSQLRSPFVLHKTQIENCYRQTLKQNPEAEGSLELKFHINENGRVYHTVYLKAHSTLQDIELAQCLKRAADNWQFPQGRQMQITYPFEFTRSKMQN